MKPSGEIGILLPNGSRIVHGKGANIKAPMPQLYPDLAMHELAPGYDLRSEMKAVSYNGQLGIGYFTDEYRLPRHVHIAQGLDGKEELIYERILVLSGVALVELNGQVYVIAPGSLVTIAPGVPHTWTACPAGLRLPDGEISSGKFTMVYEYEAPTTFYPIANTDTLRSVEEYQAKRYEGDIQEIQFPSLSVEDLVESAKLAWGATIVSLRNGAEKPETESKL